MEEDKKNLTQQVLDLESAAATASSDRTTLETDKKSLLAQVQELQAAAAAAAPMTVSLEADKKILLEQVEELKTAAATAASSSEAKEALEKDVANLQAALEIKEKENEKVTKEKDKLEAYTKRTLSKFQDKYLVALQECKTKLKEKQDKIEALEARSATERTNQKREERLMSSSIYELGLAIMQNKLKSSTSGS